MTHTILLPPDPEGQIADLRAERDALLDDLVRAERQLSAVRSERDQLSGLLRRLASQVEAGRVGGFGGAL